MRGARAVAVIAIALAAAGCSTADPAIDAGPPSTTSTTAAGTGGALGAELGKLQPEATGAFVGRAAQRTLDAETGTFVVSMVVDEGTPDALVIMEVQGTYDHDRGVSSTLLDISGLAEHAPEALSEDPDEQSVMKIVFRDPLEIVEDADTTYLRAQRLTDLLQSPTEWITMPLDSEDSFGGIASAFEVGDLGEFLSGLDSAGEVTDLGQEDLDGVGVWHYLVTIGDGAGGGGLFGAIAGEADEHGTVEVWVDDQGVIHRMTAVGSTAAVMPALGADFGGADLAGIDFGPGDVTLVIELRDLGLPTAIDVPDVADTTPLDELGS
jgi:hypothetical protein